MLLTCPLPSIRSHTLSRQSKNIVRDIHMACDAPWDFGCVIFPEYLFIPALVAMFLVVLQYQFNPTKHITIPSVHLSGAKSGWPVAAYRASCHLSGTVARQFAKLAGSKGGPAG